MKISGIMPLRNGVVLSYPFELAIRSLKTVCDEVIVAVDPTSEDDTRQRVAALDVTIVESVWNMSNHNGRDDEIAKQTAIALSAATGDWVISLQADELLHERDADLFRFIARSSDGITGYELKRLYFYGGLDRYRDNWTFPLLRFFKRGCWKPDPESGAMQFVPVGQQRKWTAAPRIYHYSRVGDPKSVALRVRNLDHFYHPPERILGADDVKPYDFETLRKLDTYVLNTPAVLDEEAKLIPFPANEHPAGVVEHFT